jgi:hypothetical protein
MTKPPIDSRVAELVRDSLDDHARNVHVPTPDWAELEARLRVIRTARQRRIAVAGSALLTAAVIGAGLTAGHVGAGRRALDGVPAGPSPTASARPTTFPAKLDDGNVRGSLKHDTAWLTAFRQVVARDRKRPVQSVRVAYASDVRDRRIAYVFAGPTSGRRIAAWYEGRGQAAAARMRSVGSHNFGGTTTPTWDAYSLGISNLDTIGGAVIITTHDQTWQVAGPAIYHANGTVIRAVRTLHPDAEGVLEIALPLNPGATYLIRSTDEPAAQHWAAISSWTTAVTGVNGAPTLSGIPLVHDAPPADVTKQAQGQLQESLFRLQNEAGLRGSPSGARGLWAGRMGPWATTTVVGVTAPSGARIISVDLSAPTGPSSGIGTQVRTVLPAGPLDQATVAWVVTTPNQSGSRASLGVGVLGPVGAQTARTTNQDGRTVEVPLRGGAALIPLQGPAHPGAVVEFLGPDAAVVATTTVLPAGSELPTGVPSS